MTLCHFHEGPFKDCNDNWKISFHDKKRDLRQNIIILIPEEDDEVNNAVLFEPEVKSQNKGTLCKLKMTFSGRHQRLSQHLEEVQEDKPHDQIQAQGPTKETKKVNMTFKFQSSEKIKDIYPPPIWFNNILLPLQSKQIASYNEYHNDNSAVKTKAKTKW